MIALSNPKVQILRSISIRIIRKTSGSRIYSPNLLGYGYIGVIPANKKIAVSFGCQQYMLSLVSQVTFKFETVAVNQTVLAKWALTGCLLCGEANPQQQFEFTFI